MSRTATIAVVVVVAVVAFGGAFLAFSGDDDPTTQATGPSAGSGGEADEDDPCATPGAQPVEGSPYEVTVASEPDPPTPRGSIFEVVVEREGQPVTGATVCMTFDMTGMSHGASGEAEEDEPGRYEVGVDFGMRGTWEGAVFVTEPGERPVSAPVRFDVE